MKNAIVVVSKSAPTVEIDTEALAAYVRFSRASVARTESKDRRGVVVAIDYDKSGSVIGVELVGVREFGVHRLLTTAGVEAPNANLDRSRYITAGHLELATAG